MEQATKPTLLVLAAGMGSRYGGLKQVEPIGPSGETIIDYSIYDALRAGFGRLVFVIRKDIEEPFKQTIGARFEKRVAVEYVFQELDKMPPQFPLPPERTKPWGTGHAILMGAEAISEPFAVVNGDDFYGAQSFKLLAEHLRSNTPEHSMVGFVLRKTLSEFGTVARGVCQVGENGHLLDVTEMTGIEKDGNGAKCMDSAGQVRRFSGDEAVSMNMWGFRPAIFRHLHDMFNEFLKTRGGEQKSEFYIPAVVNTVIGTGSEHCRVLRTPDSWFGVTYREDRPRVMESLRTLIARGDYPQALWT